MNLYQQELLDHFHNSRLRGILQTPDIISAEYNPSCGDAVSITGQVVDGTIVSIRFTGTGCVISQATASLLCEFVQGKTIEEVQRLTSDSLLALIKISLGPTRLKCALLSLYALQQGISEYRQKGNHA